MAVCATGVPSGLRVESNSSPSCVQACSSIGRADSHQIHVAWLTAQHGLRSFSGVTRQSQSGGKIVSPSNWEDTEDHVGSERRVHKRLERSVPAHREEQLLSLRNGSLRARLKFARAVRHHELCLHPERFEYFLDSRQTKACPACSSRGIDKDDCRIFTESTCGIRVIPHAFSLMLW